MRKDGNVSTRINTAIQQINEKIIEFVTVATALAMMAFAAWQLWMQYFVTQGGGK